MPRRLRSLPHLVGVARAGDGGVAVTPKRRGVASTCPPTTWIRLKGTFLKCCDSAYPLVNDRVGSSNTPETMPGLEWFALAVPQMIRD
jgi:hypothetical protein